MNNWRAIWWKNHLGQWSWPFLEEAWCTPGNSQHLPKSIDITCAEKKEVGCIYVQIMRLTHILSYPITLLNPLEMQKWGPGFLLKSSILTPPWLNFCFFYPYLTTIFPVSLPAMTLAFNEPLHSQEVEPGRGNWAYSFPWSGWPALSLCPRGAL